MRHLGAVGTFAHVDPRVEAYVPRARPQPEPISTQVIHRDRHAAYFAGARRVPRPIERWRTEIRHLQRTEVLEAEEAFAKAQKVAAAMPHKRNPVLARDLTGSHAWCAAERSPRRRRGALD